MPVDRGDYRGKDLIFDKIKLRGSAEADSDPGDSESESDEGDEIDAEAPRKLRSHKVMESKETSDL